MDPLDGGMSIIWIFWKNPTDGVGHLKKIFIGLLKHFPKIKWFLAFGNYHPLFNV